MPDLASSNPLTVGGNVADVMAAAVHAGHLRRQRRPLAPQAPAGHLQPGARRRAADQLRRASASPSTTSNDETLPGVRPRRGREVLAAADRCRSTGPTSSGRFSTYRAASTTPRLPGAEAAAGGDRAASSASPATGSSTWRSRRASSASASSSSTPPGWSTRKGRALHPDHRREADRPRPRKCPRGSTPRSPRSSTSARSSASTITSARRRCRT